MSNRSGGGGGGGRGGGGRGGGGGAVRVAIPETVRKTILSIREITGKQHTDEDIYSVLKDCSMDPNETAQKLLYLDTFHEVKSKRDRRKEMSGTQSRGVRGSRGSHTANHIYPDAMGRRNAAPRMGNGVNNMTDKGPSSPLPVVQKINSDAAVSETKASAAIHNGSLSSSNGTSASGFDSDSPTDGVVIIAKDNPVVDVKKPSKVLHLSDVPPSLPNQTSASVTQAEREKSTPSSVASVSGVYSSASDPVLAPSMTPHSGAAGAIKREVGSQRRDSGNNDIQGNKPVSPDGGAEFLKNEKEESTFVHSMPPSNSKPVSADKNELSRNLQPSSAADDNSSGDNHSSETAVIPLTVVSTEDTQVADSSLMLPEQAVPADSSLMLAEPAVPNGHVIFPNHFKVPEALKSGLTFGSFDMDSGPGSSCNDNGHDISADAIELSHQTDNSARESCSSDQSVSSTAIVDHPDQPETLQVFDKLPKPDDHVTSMTDSKSDISTQEMMPLPEGHQNPAVHIAPNYGYGILPHLHGGHFVQFEGHENQGENPAASSSPSPSPSLSPTPAQLAASPQPLLFRPPYPPNYFPYGYFNPYFLPAMHQFLGHNGLPQQPTTGNPYLTQAAPAPGVKFSVPQYKPGTSTGNSTPIGLQHSYGSFGSSSVNFNPGPAVTSGSTTSNEELSASQLKESQIYTTGPLNDASAWISPSGQDMSALHLNSLYHITPQGQHIAFSHAQPGHGHYPGIYPPMQPMAAPSTVNPLMQQSQALSATAETVGPPSGAYQQTQLAQMNWNSSY